jgi:hypothetical protein
MRGVRVPNQGRLSNHNFGERATRCRHSSELHRIVPSQAINPTQIEEFRLTLTPAALHKALDSRGEWQSENGGRLVGRQISAAMPLALRRSSLVFRPVERQHAFDVLDAIRPIAEWNPCVNPRAATRSVPLGIVAREPQRMRYIRSYISLD